MCLFLSCRNHAFPGAGNSDRSTSALRPQRFIPWVSTPVVNCLSACLWGCLLGGLVNRWTGWSWRGISIRITSSIYRFETGRCLKLPDFKLKLISWERVTFKDSSICSRKPKLSTMKRGHRTDGWPWHAGLCARPEISPESNSLSTKGRSEETVNRGLPVRIRVQIEHTRTLTNRSPCQFGGLQKRWNNTKITNTTPKHVKRRESVRQRNRQCCARALNNNNLVRVVYQPEELHR